MRYLRTHRIDSVGCAVSKLAGPPSGRPGTTNRNDTSGPSRIGGLVEKLHTRKTGRPRTSNLVVCIATFLTRFHISYTSRPPVPIDG